MHMEANNTPTIIGVPKDKVKKIQVKRKQKKESNIIQFPANRVVRARARGKEDFDRKILQDKIKYVNYLTDKHMKMIFSHMVAEGVETDTQDFLEDYVFVVESLRATLFRIYDIQHPLHPLMKKHYQMVNQQIEEEEKPIKK